MLALILLAAVGAVLAPPAAPSAPVPPWLEEVCADGGGWQSRRANAPVPFTTISPATFFRAAACAVAVPALIFVPARDAGGAMSPTDAHAWSNAVAAVREKVARQKWRKRGDGGAELSGRALTLCVLDLGTPPTPHYADLWRQLGLPDGHVSGAVLALFSTNDHAEGLALLVRPAYEPPDHLDAPSARPVASIEAVTQHLAGILASTYLPINLEQHLIPYTRAPSCNMTAGGVDDESAKDLACVMGARVAILRAEACPPPRRIPEAMLERFSMNGRIPVHYPDSYRWEQLGASGRSGSCFARFGAQDVRDAGGGTAFETRLACRPLNYSSSHVSALVARAQAREKGYYHDTDVFVYRALELLGGRASLAGLRVAIIGSVEPWYEAICLAFDAAECVSVDYNPVYYNHPRLSWASIADLQADSDAAGSFDLALSISSVEHDGLGRYGDLLDPDADLAAMGFLRHLLAPGGRALLAVPVGGDLVRWNMHRIYGKHRLPR